MHQEIFQSTDAAIQKYNEVTLIDERSEKGVANAMKVGGWDRATKLIARMEKLLAVVNPAHGPAFLEEVRTN